MRWKLDIVLVAALGVGAAGCPTRERDTGPVQTTDPGQVQSGGRDSDKAGHPVLGPNVPHTHGGAGEAGGPADAEQGGGESKAGEDQGKNPGER